MWTSNRNVCFLTKAANILNFTTKIIRDFVLGFSLVSVSSSGKRRLWLRSFCLHLEVDRK